MKKIIFGLVMMLATNVFAQETIAGYELQSEEKGKLIWKSINSRMSGIGHVVNYCTEQKIGDTSPTKVVFINTKYSWNDLQGYMVSVNRVYISQDRSQPAIIVRGETNISGRAKEVAEVVVTTDETFQKVIKYSVSNKVVYAVEVDQGTILDPNFVAGTTEQGWIVSCPNP